MPDAAPYRYARQLVFRPVDEVSDAKTLIEFGRDLYVESLGTDAAFHRDFGVRGERFPRWVASCGRLNPRFSAVLKEDQQVIGLVVLGADKHDRSVGHVHHFYIISSHRGQGFGGVLDDYARAALRDAGYHNARLNVAAGNARAIRVYRAQGWSEQSQKNGGLLRYMETSL